MYIPTYILCEYDAVILRCALYSGFAASFSFNFIFDDEGSTKFFFDRKLLCFFFLIKKRNLPDWFRFHYIGVKFYLEYTIQIYATTSVARKNRKKQENTLKIQVLDNGI